MTPINVKQCANRFQIAVTLPNFGIENAALTSASLADWLHRIAVSFASPKFAVVKGTGK
jgi:hypothetical protein